MSVESKRKLARAAIGTTEQQLRALAKTSDVGYSTLLRWRRKFYGNGKTAARAQILAARHKVLTTPLTTPRAKPNGAPPAPTPSIQSAFRVFARVESELAQLPVAEATAVLDYVRARLVGHRAK